MLLYKASTIRKAATTFLLLLAAPAQAGVFFYDGDGPAIPVDEANPGRFASMRGSAKHITAMKSGVSWNISYDDVDNNTNTGFDHPTNGPERQARAEEVLAYLGGVIGGHPAAVIEVRFDLSQSDGSGSLASGGTFFSSEPGFTGGFAFDHITSGADPSPFLPDLFVRMDFGWPWNHTADPPAAGEVDLASVLLHEFTHGLGFLSLARQDGSSEIAAGVYAYFDQLLVDGSGGEIFALRGTRAQYAGGSNTLTGGAGGVFFTGPAATGVYGIHPPIYAPNTWNNGSSISHWDYAAGEPIMLPAISFGAARRAYLDFEIAALQDLGYEEAQVPGFASFTSNLQSGESPLAVQFMDESTIEATSWEWDLDGDGTIDSVRQNPSYTYNESGAYTVVLRVSNEDRTLEAIEPGYIFVADPLPLGSLAGVLSAVGILLIGLCRSLTAPQ